MVVETFTGMRPFTGQTTEQALAALLHSEYHLPGTSPEIRTLDAIVQRCIAKDPRDRYGSAAELATDLIPNLAGCAVVRAPGATGRPTRRRSDRSTLHFFLAAERTASLLGAEIGVLSLLHTWGQTLVRNPHS